MATREIGIKLLKGYLVDLISGMPRLGDWETARRIVCKEEQAEGCVEEPPVNFLNRY